MTQVLAVTTGLFRDRDLFVHDGSKLRRFRVSAPLQAVFFVITARARRVGQLCNRATDRPPAASCVDLDSSRRDRSPRPHDRAAPGADRSRARRPEDKPRADCRRERWPPCQGRPARPRRAAQLEQAALVARALDVRYQVTAAELKRLGITPARVGSTAGVGGPFESAGNSTFKSTVRQLEEARPAPGRHHRRSVGQADQGQRRVHQRLRRPLRPVPCRCRHPPRHRPCRCLRHADLCNG